MQWNYHLRKQNANTSLAGLGISPLTVSSKSKSQKVHVCQDELQRATRKLAGELILATKVESKIFYLLVTTKKKIISDSCSQIWTQKENIGFLTVLITQYENLLT